MNPEERMPTQEHLDRWLDMALRARADVEPRLGLENRVLARLAADSQRSRSAWWALPVTTAVALVITALLVGLYHRPPARTVADEQQRPLTSHHSSPRTVAQVNPATVVNKLGGHHHFPAATTVVVNDASGKEREPLPKLATFPAPRPETPEERMLLRLAARRGSYDLAASSSDAAPLKDLLVQEINIDPMEGTPPDNTPRE